jgi:hypothetical protein
MALTVPYVVAIILHDRPFRICNYPSNGVSVVSLSFKLSPLVPSTAQRPVDTLIAAYS